MRIFKNLLLVLPAILIASCGGSSSDGGNQNPDASSTVLSSSVLKYADINSIDKNTRKHYFLIAGGIDAANFAEEIIEQKRFLMSLGVSESDIACFYSIPFDEEFKQDETHYRALAEDLKKCYPAFPRNIWKLMEQGGTETGSLYVYISSHGEEPLSVLLPKFKLKEDIDWAKKWLGLLPSADQYVIYTGAGKNGEPLWYTPRFEAIQKGEGTVEDFLFTPRHLKETIKRITVPATQKIVVVQACHSGGFIQSETPKLESDTLKDLDNITIMTAARPDRASFGCGVGNHRTYFGGAYNEALFAKNKLPKDIDWQALYNEVNEKVKLLEADYLQKLSQDKKTYFKPSEPMFYKK